MAHHDNSLFLDSSLFASCPDLFPELLDLPAQAEPFGAPLGTDHLLATHSAHWTRDDPTPLASPPASSQASVASPVSSFDALWDAAALPVLDDPFFDFDCPAATGAATTTTTATATTTSAATAAPAPTPGQPQAGRSARGPDTTTLATTLTTTLPLLLTTTSAAPAGPHKEQHRATRTCSGCGLEKKRVYRYLGASAPFCNACNQHWRRHLHECPLCLKLRALNATEELRGTDITHLDGPARPRRRDPRPDALACASPHDSHDPHRPLHSGPLRRRPAHAHAHVHAHAPALHRPYAFCS